MPTSCRIAATLNLCNRSRFTPNRSPKCVVHRDTKSACASRAGSWQPSLAIQMLSERDAVSSFGNNPYSRREDGGSSPFPDFGCKRYCSRSHASHARTFGLQNTTQHSRILLHSNRPIVTKLSLPSRCSTDAALTVQSVLSTEQVDRGHCTQTYPQYADASASFPRGNLRCPAYRTRSREPSEFH